MPSTLVKLKQLESGELGTFITGLAAPLVAPIVSGILTGRYASYTFPITSGVDFETYSFGVTYTGSPKISTQIQKTSGNATIYGEIISKTSSGFRVEYSNTVGGSGYLLDTIVGL